MPVPAINDATSDDEVVRSPIPVLVEFTSRTCAFPVLINPSTTRMTAKIELRAVVEVTSAITPMTQKKDA